MRWFNMFLIRVSESKTREWAEGNNIILKNKWQFFRIEERHEYFDLRTTMASND